MAAIRRTIRDLLRRTGFDIVRLARRGNDAFADMQHFLDGVRQPLVLDVGANVGQSVGDFRLAFPGSRIHAFEPSPSTFRTLQANCAGLPHVSLWNVAVGARNATLPFLESTHSDMSSFLAPSTMAWGAVTQSVDVPVVSVDAFAAEQGIDFVHVLKSDTQGYDFEVFKGAAGLMADNRIGLIHAEFIFSDLYVGQSPFHDAVGFLTDRNFAPVWFYRPAFQDDLVGWADALFINREFHSSRMREGGAAQNTL